MADWSRFSGDLTVNLSPIANSATSVLGSISNLLQVATNALDVLSTFSVNGSNPLDAGLVTLQQLLGTLTALLTDNSVFGLLMFPESEDQLDSYTGGFAQFERLFLDALTDPSDSNRPDLDNASVLGGLVLYAGYTDLVEMITQAKALFSSLGLEFPLQLPAPVDVKADPTLAGSGVLELFSGVEALQQTTQPDSLMFQWREPISKNGSLLNWFDQTYFVLERSKNLDGSLLVLEAPDTNRLQTPLEKKSSQTVYVPVLNDQGNEVRYWELMSPNSPLIKPSDLFDPTSPVLEFNFLSGTYAYLLTPVEPGASNAYYYRVRAVPKNTTVKKVDALVLRDKPVKEEIYELYVNNVRLTDTIAPASQPIRGYVPILPDSSLYDQLLTAYRLAYLLRFDVEIKDASGVPLPGSKSVAGPLRNSVLRSIPSLSTYAATLDDEPVFFFRDPLQTESFLEASGNQQDLNTVDPDDMDPFGGVDEFIAPSIDANDRQRFITEIDRLVLPQVQSSLSRLVEYESARDLFSQQFSTYQAEFELILSEGLSLSQFEDTTLRQRLTSLLSLLSTIERTGVEPNWQKFDLVSTAFPALSQLGTVLAQVSASIDIVSRQASEEISAVQQGLQNRLEVMDRLISTVEVLLETLNLFETLGASLNVLSVPPSVGGTDEFIREFSTSKQKPPYDANEVFFGMSFLVGGSDLNALGSTLQHLAQLFGV